MPPSPRRCALPSPLIRHRADHTLQAIATLKTDTNVPKFKEAQDAVVAKLLSAPGVHAAAYAVTAEAGSQAVLLLLVGWDSVEVRLTVWLAKHVLTIWCRPTRRCVRYPGARLSSHPFMLPLTR